MTLPALSSKKSQRFLDHSSRADSTEATDTNLSSKYSLQKDVANVCYSAGSGTEYRQIVSSPTSVTTVSVPGSVCDEISPISMCSTESTKQPGRTHKYRRQYYERQCDDLSNINQIFTIEGDDQHARRHEHMILISKENEISTDRIKKSNGKKYQPPIVMNKSENVIIDTNRYPPDQPECKGANVTHRLHKKYFIEDRELHRFFIESLCQKELTLNCFAKLVTGTILLAVLVLFIVTLYRFLT